ncbi:oxidoreductase [Actinomadura soli]|uniref:Oxidoreductase n=1 Tax=Actinomadura soli TaxID=2508997 RepID=A0A5C4JF89_9ACTN|nr:FAD-dependent monooxygenase [Actinomadura soli]TMR02604.1 oxidoreductase [Actinomadura soli]
MRTQVTQVTVVGAGPVGLLLAGELRLGGAAVVVLERLDEPVAQTRASTLHARTMEFFEQRGLRASLGSPPSHRMGHFGGIPLDLGLLPTPFPGQWKVPQPRLEALLAEWASGLGADIRRGHDVTGLVVEDDRVLVDVLGPSGPYQVESGHVVGCDGEGSTVRRAAGIGFPGRDATGELLAADVAGIAVQDRRFERLPGGLAVAAKRPDDGLTRVMVAVDGHAAGTEPPTFADVQTAWRRVTGEDISGGTARWLHAFRDGSRLAERYRAGRVLLAGDAAHRQLPAGGQAINLGLQDAANLGWKLAAVAIGRAPHGLLDTYDEERRSVGRRVQRGVDAQAALLLGGAELDPLRAVLAELIGYPQVRDQLAGLVTGLDVRYGPFQGVWGAVPPQETDGGPHPLVGARIPPGDGWDGTAAALRSARGVLLVLTAVPEHRAALRDAAAGWAGRVDLVAPDRHPGGPVAGLDAVLLRPDGHVAWAGAGSDDPRPMLRHWFGSVGTSHKGDDR